MALLDGLDLSQLPFIGGLLNQPATFNDRFPAATFADRFDAMPKAPAPPLPLPRPAAADQATFADRFNALPNAPQPVVPSGRKFSPETFDAATYAPNQAQPIAIGNYMMPRIGSADLYKPDPAALPQNAQPTQGQGNPVEQPNVPETSLLGRIGNALRDNSNLLLGLGAGLAGAPSIGTGLSRAFQLAAPGSQLDLQQAMQRGAIGPTYTALVKAGVPKEQAVAAIYNPELMKSVIQNYITDRKGEVKTVKDALGGERLVYVNPYDANQPAKDLTPKGSGSAGMLASGVEEYNPNLTGQAYIDQFSPDMKAAIKAWLNGDQMPTGNPRMQSIWNQAKVFAGNYANQMGLPFSDTTYQEKRKLKTDLGSSGNSSLGGILSNGESSFAHLAEAGESMAKLGNASHNFLLGGPLAHAENYTANALVPSSETQSKIKALNNNLGRYGQESTKFYAGSGGGVEERTAARKEMNAETTSSEEYAGYLEKEKSLMLDRLEGKFAQMRQVLGPEEAEREIAKHMPDIQKNIARIDQSIARLRGGPKQAETAATQAGSPPPGSYAWTPDKGLVPAQ